MTGGETLALGVALGLPVVATLAAVAAPAGPAPARMVQGGATMAAAAWLILVSTGARGRAGGFHVSPVVAAGGCGAALLVAAGVDGLRGRRALGAAGGALAALGVGLTAGGGTGPTLPAVVGGFALAVAAAVDATPRERRALPAALAVAGVVAAGAAFLVLHARAGGWALPAAGVVPRVALVVFLAAAALLSAAGAVGGRSTVVLVAAGLALGLSVAPLRTGAAALGPAVVVLSAAAVVAAGARHAPLSFALLALAVAAGPPSLAPASLLLAAAAVVALAVDQPWALLAAVPAGVSLADGVVVDDGRLALAVAVAAAVVAVLVTQVVDGPSSGDEGVDSGQGGHRLLPGTFPAAAVGAWLVVAPGSWRWTGAALAAYDRGGARAVAAALLAVMARALVAQRPFLTGTERAGGPPARRRRLVAWAGSASKPRPRRPASSQRARPRARPGARGSTSGSWPGRFWWASPRWRRRPPGT